jgi:hypothetical protein
LAVPGFKPAHRFFFRTAAFLLFVFAIASPCIYTDRIYLKEEIT